MNSTTGKYADKPVLRRGKRKLVMEKKKNYAEFTNAELLEMQQAAWTVGASDDTERIAECLPIVTEEHRNEVIDFLLDLDASYFGW